MNNTITAQIIKKHLFNQKQDKLMLTSVFSQHFLSKSEEPLLGPYIINVWNFMRRIN